MPRPSLESFKRTDGGIDWDGLRKAEIANGDICSECYAGILFGGKGYPERCHDCKRLSSDKGEVEHGKSIRCPKCHLTLNPYEFEVVNLDEAIREAFSGGDGIDVTCHHCDADFRVGVRGELHFTSPALLEDGKKDDQDEDA
jgi:RNase P subunit RPR2